MAVHLFTANRVTTDAEFSGRAQRAPGTDQRIQCIDNSYTRRHDLYIYC